MRKNWSRLARICGRRTWGISAVYRKRWVVGKIERGRGTLSSEIYSACSVFSDSRAGRHSSGTGAGHLRGCGEWGGRRNERRGKRFDVKASLGRRWLRCGIHGTERAAVSVRLRALTEGARAGYVRVLSKAPGGGFANRFRLCQLVLRRISKISLTHLGRGSVEKCEINCRRMEV